MYPNQMINNSLSITKILNGISKSISVANQVIPIYKKAKPLINNFSNATNFIKSITKDNNSKIKEAKLEQKKEVSNNLPTFFQ